MNVLANALSAGIVSAGTDEKFSSTMCKKEVKFIYRVKLASFGMNVLANALSAGTDEKFSSTMCKKEV